MITTIKYLLLFLLMIMQSNVLLAKSKKAIGRIVKIRGKVLKKVSDNKYKAIKNGDSLFEGDMIISKERSFVKVLMKDDTLFQLGPKSKFAFEKFKMKTKSDRAATYNLLQGKLRSLFTVKSKERSLKIKTPTASMGIRGTEIVSDVYKYRGKIQTDIALISGKLEVTTLSKKKFFLNRGHMVELRKSVRGSVDMKNRKLPTQMFKNLRKGSKGGNIFLLDARKSSGEIKKNEVKFTDLKANEVVKAKKGDKETSLTTKNERIVIKKDSSSIKTKNNSLSLKKDNIRTNNLSIKSNNVKSKKINAVKKMAQGTLKEATQTRSKIILEKRSIDVKRNRVRRQRQAAATALKEASRDTSGTSDGTGTIRPTNTTTNNIDSSAGTSDITEITNPNFSTGN